jgi:hypothetical protein
VGTLFGVRSEVVAGIVRYSCLEGIQPCISTGPEVPLGREDDSADVTPLEELGGCLVEEPVRDQAGPGVIVGGVLTMDTLRGTDVQFPFKVANDIFFVRF